MLSSVLKIFDFQQNPRHNNSYKLLYVQPRGAKRDMTIEEQIDDLAVVGEQTGDEGKGKIVAHIARKAVKYLPQRPHSRPRVVVARWAGGANAGHTNVFEKVVYKLHQVPSGIIVPQTYNLLAEGCLFDPLSGAEEIRLLKEMGVKVSSQNLGIASNAHVTLAYHIDEDGANFHKTDHTSTGNGIKPTAVDKYGRVGMRFEEFLDRDTFKEILKERRFPNGLPEKFGDFEAFATYYDEARETLQPFSILQTDILADPETDLVIWEGAQGFRLDVDRGYYPGVTSSNPSIVPAQVGKILGLVKLYESSVGKDRPFVGQIQDPVLEEKLRERWGEFGTTTGRKRDLGWFDAVAVAHAVKTTQTDYLVSTCGDRLEYLTETGEPARIFVGYKIDGRTYNEWDRSFHNRKTLYGAKPIFEEFTPWNRFTDENGRLHPNAQRYVDRIQELVDAEFIMHSTGPGEDDIIELKDPLTA